MLDSVHSRNARKGKGWLQGVPINSLPARDIRRFEFLDIQMMLDPRDWKAIFPLTLCLLLLLGSVANTQSRNTTQPQAKTPAGEPNSSTNPEFQIKPLRAKARSRLSSLSTDTCNFRDQTLRARPDEALKLVIESQSKGQSSSRNKYVAEFDLEGISGDLVAKNYGSTS